jgi:hypothetical protein
MKRHDVEAHESRRARPLFRAAPGELVHPGVSEFSPRREIVVDPAEKPDVLDGRWTASGTRNPVIKFHAGIGAASAARFQRPLAPAAISRPDGALHGRRQRFRLRTWRSAARLLGETLALRVALQDEVEPRFEDLLRASAWKYV